MEKIKKYWFVLSLNLIIVILGIYNLPSLLDKPYLKKEYVDVLKNGNIVKVNDIYINSVTHLEAVLDHYRVGDEVNLTIESLNSKFTVELTNYYDIFFVSSSIISSIFFIFPGIFILLKIKDEQIAVLFNLMMLSVASLVLLTYGSLDYGIKIINIINRSIVQISYIFLGVFFLEFSLLFPFKKYNFITKNFNKINIGLSILIFPLLVLNYHYVTKSDIYTIEIYYKLTDNILKPFFGISFIFVLINLILSFKSNSSSINRQKLLWIFLSVLWGPMVYFVLYQFPFLLGLDFAISETSMQYLIILSPISLFIGIYKYNLLDINLFFKRSFVYGLIIFLIIILYTFVLFIYSNFVSNDKNNQLPYIISLILIALIFHPLRKYILVFTDKYVFKIKFNVNNIIEKFKQEINSILFTDLTFDLLEEYILKYIAPKEYIFISKVEDSEYEISNKKNLIFDKNEVESFVKSIDYQNYISPISKDNFFVDDVEFSKNNLEFLNDELDIIFFNKLKESEFYLILGKKSNNILFTYDDVHLLNNLVKETNNQISRIILNKNILFKNEEIKKLEELNELKSYFVSSITHDLKTPLTSIKLLAELMVSYDNIAINDKNKYLNLIISESDRLNRLVNNVLDFSKIEKGVKKYNFQKCDINQIIDNTLLSITNYLNLKKFNLNYEKNNDELFAYVDSDAISEILNNLIENAVKYSFEKKEISVNSYKLNEQIIIEVSDCGIGISEENQKRIFDAYSRADDDRIKSISGTGIGLSVVKNIIEAHNAKIEVNSKIDEGTKFRIYLKEYTNENLNS